MPHAGELPRRAFIETLEHDVGVTIREFTVGDEKTTLEYVSAHETFDSVTVGGEVSKIAGAYLANHANLRGGFPSLDASVLVGDGTYKWAIQRDWLELALSGDISRNEFLELVTGTAVKIQ